MPIQLGATVSQWLCQLIQYKLVLRASTLAMQTPMETFFKVLKYKFEKHIYTGSPLSIASFDLW